MEEAGEGRGVILTRWEPSGASAPTHYAPGSVRGVTSLSPKVLEKEAWAMQKKLKSIGEKNHAQSMSEKMPKA
jgi:hypothetical protein